MADLRASLTDGQKNQQRTALTEIIVIVRTDSVSTGIEKYIEAALQQLAVAASAAFPTSWYSLPKQIILPKALILTP